MKSSLCSQLQKESFCPESCVWFQSVMGFKWLRHWCLRNRVLSGKCWTSFKGKPLGEGLWCISSWHRCFVTSYTWMCTFICSIKKATSCYPNWLSTVGQIIDADIRHALYISRTVDAWKYQGVLVAGLRQETQVHFFIFSVLVIYLII